MYTKNEDEKSNKSLIWILVIVGLLGGGVVIFVVKPYGDRFPFDDVLYKTTNNNLEYYIKRVGKGPRPKKGDFLIYSVAYRKKKFKNPIFDTKSKKTLTLPPIQFDKTAIKKNGGVSSIMQEAMKLSKKGGEIWIKVTPKILFGGQEVAVNKEFLKKYDLKIDSTIIFELCLDSIMTKDEYIDSQKAKMKEFEKKMKQRHVEEVKIIDSHINSSKFNKKNIVKLNNGVRYSITKHHRKNSFVKKGSQVEVEYTLKALVVKKDGSIVEELIGKENTRTRFQVGANPPEIIRGLDLTLPKLRLGESATVWLPSSEGYSIFGSGKLIKPNTILLYDISVVDMYLSIKNKNQNYSKVKAAPAA